MCVFVLVAIEEEILRSNRPNHTLGGCVCKGGRLSAGQCVNLVLNVKFCFREIENVAEPDIRV